MPRRTRSPEEKRKWEIRRQVTAARDRLSEEERADKSRIIFTRVMQAWEYQQAETILAYAHFRSEVQTDRLLRATLESGKRLALPRVNRQRHELDLYLVTDPGAAVGGGNVGHPRARPRAVPARAAGGDRLRDRPRCGLRPLGRAHRLRRRLFYDRLLNRLSPAQARVCLGLAFEAQIVYEVPRGLFDAHVGAVATELRLVENR